MRRAAQGGGASEGGRGTGLAEAMTCGMKEEELRQLGLIYGGLMASVVIVRLLLTATSLDLSAEI